MTIHRHVSRESSQDLSQDLIDYAINKWKSTDLSRCLLSGWLSKQGNSSYLKRWKKRFCVLTKESLFYFGSNNDTTPIGVLFIDNESTLEVSEKVFGICVNSSCALESRKVFGRRIYYFEAEKEWEQRSWLTTLESLCNQETVKKIRRGSGLSALRGSRFNDRVMMMGGSLPTFSFLDENFESRINRSHSGPSLPSSTALPRSSLASEVHFNHQQHPRSNQAHISEYQFRHQDDPTHSVPTINLESELRIHFETCTQHIQLFSHFLSPTSHPNNECSSTSSKATDNGNDMNILERATVVIRHVRQLLYTFDASFTKNIATKKYDACLSHLTASLIDRSKKIGILAQNLMDITAASDDVRRSLQQHLGFLSAEIRFFIAVGHHLLVLDKTMRGEEGRAATRYTSNSTLDCLLKRVFSLSLEFAEFVAEGQNDLFRQSGDSLSRLIYTSLAVIKSFWKELVHLISAGIDLDSAHGDDELLLRYAEFLNFPDTLDEWVLAMNESCLMLMAGPRHHPATAIMQHSTVSILEKFLRSSLLFVRGLVSISYLELTAENSSIIEPIWHQLYALLPPSSSSNEGYRSDLLSTPPPTPTALSQCDETLHHSTTAANCYELFSPSTHPQSTPPTHPQSTPPAHSQSSTPTQLQSTLSYHSQSTTPCIPIPPRINETFPSLSISPLLENLSVNDEAEGELLLDSMSETVRVRSSTADDFVSQQQQPHDPQFDQHSRFDPHNQHPRFDPHNQRPRFDHHNLQQRQQLSDTKHDCSVNLVVVKSTTEFVRTICNTTKFMRELFNPAPPPLNANAAEVDRVGGLELSLDTLLLFKLQTQLSAATGQIDEEMGALEDQSAPSPLIKKLEIACQNLTASCLHFEESLKWAASHQSADAKNLAIKHTFVIDDSCHALLVALNNLLAYQIRYTHSIPHPSSLPSSSSSSSANPTSTNPTSTATNSPYPNLIAQWKRLRNSSSPTLHYEQFPADRVNDFSPLVKSSSSTTALPRTSAHRTRNTMSLSSSEDFKHELDRKMIATLLDEEEAEMKRSGKILFRSVDVNQVKGGVLESLVERLTFYKFPSADFMSAFLLTYRSFTSSSELMRLLITRYTIKPPATLNPDQQKLYQSQKIIPVRLRVLNVFKMWVKYNYEDFEGNPEMLEHLKSFLPTIRIDFHQGTADFEALLERKAKSVLSPPQSVNLVSKNSQLKDSNSKAVELSDSHSKDSQSKNLNAQNGQLQSPITCAVASPIESDLSTMNPLELARQITVEQWRMFSVIQPSECLDQSWNTQKLHHRSPNIRRLIQYSNFLVRWVATEVVQSGISPKTRSLTIKFFILVAEHLRSIFNFDGLKSVLFGLQASGVSRLKKSWELVPAKVVAIWDGLLELMSEQKSSKTYRDFLHTSNPPCLPFIGLYLTDLTMIETGNPDMLKNHPTLINFHKRYLVAQVIQEIKRYQCTAYNFTPVSYIISRMHVTPLFDAEKVYQLSLELEPRTPTTVSISSASVIETTSTTTSTTVHQRASFAWSKRSSAIES